MNVFSRAYVELRFAQTEEVTVARAEYGGLVGRGSAKKHPDDAHNPEIGRLLATSRALRNLQVQLDARADRLIHPPKEAQSLWDTIREIFRRYLQQGPPPRSVEVTVPRA